MCFLHYRSLRIVRKIEAFLMLVFVSAAVSGFAFAQQKAQQPAPKLPASSSSIKRPAENSAPGGPQKLPLRRVVLYKSGIGYFEHDGHVRGNEDVEIDLTSGQLNDVLKSLTALDFSGGRIVGAGTSKRRSCSAVSASCSTEIYLSGSGRTRSSPGSAPTRATWHCWNRTSENSTSRAEG